jgi:hypothetical protein
VFAREPELRVPALVVICFQNWKHTHHLDHAGFGEDFLSKNNIHGIYVNCISNVWWQYADLHQALELVAAAAEPFPERVVYGSSMGGYAALRFADILGATMVIAASPQFSPRRNIVPAESHYEKAISGVNFEYEEQSLEFRDIPRFLLYDPFLKIDKEQAFRYTQFGRINLVPIPASGHPCLTLLMEQKRLSSVVKQMIEGSFDIDSFKSEQRKLRRSTYRYWDQLSVRLAERRKLLKAAKVAERAAECFVENNDKALSLALRWALYAGDHVYAGMITAKISAGYPEAVRLWIEADEHRRRVLSRRT